jgi:CRP-like cAMP-binding protein
MKNTLYEEVLRNLYSEQLYEKKDKHLLLDCLPYSLKNKLIMEMYKYIIKKFVFFKDIHNGDFIVKVITSLRPLISIKGDIIIQEGDFVKEIIFVKRGIIELNICIDLNNPENSIKKYFGKNKIGKLDLSYLKPTFLKNNRSNIINLDNNLESILSNKDYENICENNTKNIEDIKIIEIRNNEYFGDALMFLNEPSPLIAMVKTKIAELLILRKLEAVEIYSIYPNIWKRINKKSLFNMEQIYLKIKKNYY